METCSCGREMYASEAAVSRRAYRGEALCSVCRMRRVDAGAIIHEAPPSCSWLGIRATGYGQWTAPLKTPDGQVFHGYGWSDVQAMERARAAARKAGALV